MASDELHTDRGRAESFGSVAGQYDRYRPTAPEALIDDLAALGPKQILDIGCGTGKAALPLAQRGLSVLGVEVDERMAELARGHGLEVEIATFETWNDSGRQFDLITCGNAWHWIDPDLGFAKAARILRPGGAMALFWNYHVVEDPLLSAFDAVYREHTPELHVLGRAPRNGTTPGPFTPTKAFTSAETKTYAQSRTLTAQEWTALAATFSDHQRLPPPRLKALQQALHRTIQSHGGTVTTTCRTQSHLALSQHR